MRKAIVFHLLCAVLSLYGVGGVESAEVIVPFGSCGWKYAFGICGSVPSLSVVGFDDSAWATGCTPFVAPWGCSAPGTPWVITNGSQCYGRVVLRRHIYNPGGTAFITYRIRARYAIEAAWNGNPGAKGGLSDYCPPSEIGGIFPLSPGDNVIAVEAYAQEDAAGNRSGGQLDVELSAEGLTAITPQSWGSLKVIYR